MRRASEETISFSSLPRRAEVVVEATPENAAATKTEAEEREARAPLQRTDAIGVTNTDIGRETVRRGETETAATHGNEAATAETPEARGVVADTATQEAYLPMRVAARGKAAADTDAAVGHPATAGRLPGAVATTEGAAHHTHQRPATTEDAREAATRDGAAHRSIAAAASTTGKSTVALIQVQHLVRAAPPDHTPGADGINVDDSRTPTARTAQTSRQSEADHKTSSVRVAQTQRSRKKPRARREKTTSRRKPSRYQK